MTDDNDFELDTGAERTDWTSDFSCVYGSYRWLNAGPIHYLSTTLSLNDLRDHTITLMEEIDGVERWGFDAIFQRNIDRERVTRIVKTYLNREDRFKFFPAITVVLLPAQNNRILPAYLQDLTRKTKESITYWQMPGLEIHFRAHAGAPDPRSNQMARLKWDRTKFLAAVVDGQHRVAALREYMDARADQRTAEKDVPAIVVLFDPDLFSNDAAQKRNLTQLTRELFIDVNQNATKVADSRLIVLDDRDVSRGATRSLIFESKEDDQGTWALPKWIKVSPDIDLDVLPGIPQEVVDAFADRKNSDNLKLKPWQYTSAFTLQRAIRHFVFEDSWKRFERVLELNTLEAEGGVVWDAICERRDQLLGDDDDDDGDEMGYAGEEEFSFSPAITRRLVEHFAGGVGLFLRAVLTGFTPYQRALQACTKAFATKEGPDIRSYLLNEAPLSDDAGKRRSQYARNLAEQFPEKLDKIEATIKTFEKTTGWRDSLVWWSVLQRGLLWQPKEIQRAMEAATDAPQVMWAQCAGRYVVGLNSLYEKGIFKRTYEVAGKQLWGGIVVRLASDTLDYTDSAAKRAGALLRVLVAAEISQGRKVVYDEFRQLCDRNKSLAPAWKRCLASYAKAYRNRDKQERRAEREAVVYKEEAEQHLSSCIQKIVFQGPTRSAAK